MKLVIHTQIRENYGAHDWSGEGECPQYWKNKGGETYIVEGITDAQEAKIMREGIPHLSKLIENSSNYLREHIISYSVIEGHKQVCESWEFPIFLSYKDGKWSATQTFQASNDYPFAEGVSAKRVRYDLGRESSFEVSYLVGDEWVVNSEFTKRLNAA